MGATAGHNRSSDRQATTLRVGAATGGVHREPSSCSVLLSRVFFYVDPPVLSMYRRLRRVVQSPVCHQHRRQQAVPIANLRSLAWSSSRKRAPLPRLRNGVAAVCVASARPSLWSYSATAWGMAACVGIRDADGKAVVAQVSLEGTVGDVLAELNRAKPATWPTIVPQQLTLYPDAGWSSPVRVPVAHWHIQLY
jgi:hypothetical protein